MFNVIGILRFIFRRIELWWCWWWAVAVVVATAATTAATTMATGFQINFELALKWIHNVPNIKMECVIRSVFWPKHIKYFIWSRAQHKKIYLKIVYFFSSRQICCLFTWMFVVVVVIRVIGFVLFCLAMMNVTKYLLLSLLSLLGHELWCWGICNPQWSIRRGTHSHKHKRVREHPLHRMFAHVLSLSLNNRKKNGLE